MLRVSLGQRTAACVLVLGTCDLCQLSWVCLALCVCVWPSLGPWLKSPHGTCSSGEILTCSSGDREHKHGTCLVHNLNPFVW